MIETYYKAYSENFCDSIIEIFSRMDQERLTKDQKGINRNSDTRVMYDWSPHHSMHYYHHDIVKEFYSTLHEKYLLYSEKYEIMKELASHSPKGMCIQRTRPDQGYHIWHCESSGLASSSRVLAYTLYLNNVTTGGETEYIYQKTKIAPEQGLLVLWPAFFTHPHRGNPPYSNDKYIITGWYTYDQ